MLDEKKVLNKRLISEAIHEATKTEFEFTE